MAGEGWDGDRVLLLVNEEQDRYVLVLRTIWDSVGNAEEFFSFYVTFMDRAGVGPEAIDEPESKEWRSEDQVTYLTKWDREVLLVLTSDKGALDLVLTGFPDFQ